MKLLILHSFLEDSASVKESMSDHDTDSEDGEKFFEVISQDDIDSIENSDAVSQSFSTVVLEDVAEAVSLENRTDELSSFGATIALELAKIKDHKILRETKRKIYNYVLDAQSLDK